MAESNSTTTHSTTHAQSGAHERGSGTQSAAPKDRDAAQEKAAADAKAAVNETADEVKKRTEDINKKMAVKPTPTQFEADMAAVGQNVLQKEDDGSGPDPFATRHLRPSQGGPGYQTRDAGSSRQHRANA